MGSAAPAAEQMACCKAGHHTCGQNGSSSDCCKKKGTAVSRVGISTLTAHYEFNSPLAVALPVDYAPVNRAAVSSDVTAISFKRPHDPPHLHSFALLI